MPHAEPVPTSAGTLAEPAAPEGDFLARTRAFEASLLRHALQANRFNQRAASRALGLTYYQFRHHLKSHGLLGRAEGGEAEKVSEPD